LITRLQVCDLGLLVTVGVLGQFLLDIGGLGRFIVDVFPHVGLLDLFARGYGVLAHVASHSRQQTAVQIMSTLQPECPDSSHSTISSSNMPGTGLSPVNGRPTWKAKREGNAAGAPSSAASCERVTRSSVITSGNPK
jgi:hypothetical protein